ncbi:MAG: 30S ribosome-binding factor RbfA [Salinivirgaceae bacterium]|nr:MAG: 30S ribosome-binding factor RbfA [Salinivirgaceae bacterium]
MKEESQRQKKISRQIQKDIGEMLQQQGPSIQQGVMFTVTKVRVTADMSIARIYLSLFPANDPELVVKKINDQAGELRYNLGKRVRHQFRVVPELHFYLDDSLDYIERIEDKLNE